MLNWIIVACNFYGNIIAKSEVLLLVQNEYYYDLKIL